MRSLPLIFAGFLLAASLAAAQVPNQPTPVYTVTIENAPATFTGLDQPNATSSAAFQVVLRLANVVCAQPVSIPVTITTSAASPPGYFSVAPQPDVINFTIAQGPHLEATSPAGGTGDSAAVATITGNITSDASVAVTVQASAPSPAGCQGAGAVGTATSEPVTIYANMTAPPPPPEPTPEDEDTPFVGVVALAAVLVGAALARRRRA